MYKNAMMVEELESHHWQEKFISIQPESAQHVWIMYFKRRKSFFCLLLASTIFFCWLLWIPQRPSRAEYRHLQRGDQDIWVPDEDIANYKPAGLKASPTYRIRPQPPLPFISAADTEGEERIRLMEKAADAIDMRFIDFEEATSQETLSGWEDGWISNGVYNQSKWGLLSPATVDFIYAWVNGSDEAFSQTMEPYILTSSLKEALVSRSGKNRYRDWDELRYSIRSIETYAPFKNKIQILVNSVRDPATREMKKQEPQWLSREEAAREIVQVLSQDEYFEEDMQGCLPTFNSLTMENQIYNTPSNVDRVFALSDDMLLGKPHTSSDIYTSLFGEVLSFKTNSYNTVTTPNEADARRFGEKPWLIYTSWLLNRRFGERKRSGQAHFGHSLSRRTMREAFESFPAPSLQSACSRFRGDIQGDINGFQIYSWYLYSHYVVERHRETLLWSYLALRSDVDGDGKLDWHERQHIVAELMEGLENMSTYGRRYRFYYHQAQILEAAGLEPPQTHREVLWTSMDGPVMTKDIDCDDFDVNECLAHGFATLSTEDNHRSPAFSTSLLFDRVARQKPHCGDCLTKIILHRTARGMEPLLPNKHSQAQDREVVIKALNKYQYSIVDPDALFLMVTDAEQVEVKLYNHFIKKGAQVGQLCLNDDLASDGVEDLEDMKRVMTMLYEGMFPERSPYEKGK